MRGTLPLVSIVIPVFNGSNYLREAIDSALKQNYSNIEVIVVDDGSTDDGKTVQIVRSYGERVRLIEKPNGGSSSALNAGLRAMKGEYFSWLSHDDLYLPQKVSRGIAALQGASDDLGADLSPLQMAVCESELIDSKGRVLRHPSVFASARRARIAARGPATTRVVASVTYAAYHGCAYLIPRAALARIGGFDERLRMVNDSDAWFRLLASGVNLVYHNEILVQGRVHREQVTEQLRSSVAGSLEHAEQIKTIVTWCSENRDSALGPTLFRLGIWLGLRGRHDSAALALAEAARATPAMAFLAPPTRLGLRALGCLRTRAARIAWAVMLRGSRAAPGRRID